MRWPSGFVGRLEELEAFTEILRTASGGKRRQGASVAVSGESGIGKTRLLAEFCRLATDRGFVLARGTAWASSMSPVLWPWHEALADLDIGAEILGADQDEPGRRSRFEALADASRFILDSLGSHPTLIVLDDMHEAEPTAAMLSRMVATGLATRPVVVVNCWRSGENTFRYEETNSILSSIRPRSIDMPLGGLSAAEIIDYGHHLGDLAIDGSDAEKLLARTGGHPVLLQAVLDQFGVSPPDVVPLTARQILDERLNQLPKSCELPIRRLAVLNRPSSAADIQRRFGGPDSESEEAELTADALAIGLQFGLLQETGRRFTIIHDLYRIRLLERARPSDLADDHAQAARTVPTPSHALDHLAAEQAVHLAESALLGNAEIADEAVCVLSEIAAAATRNGAYEYARGLWTTVVEIHDCFIGAVPAELLVKHAESLLFSGRFVDARRHFDTAVTVAINTGDSVSAAVAALRLGGVWVNEHRDPVVAARVRAQQLQALDNLDRERFPALGLRLDARLVAEEVYHGRPLEDLEQLVDQLRALNDNRALAEGLLLLIHCCLAPDHVERRKSVASELTLVAAAEGDESLRLLAGCWHVTNLLLSHDRTAMAAFASWKAQVDAVGTDHLRFIADCMDVMNLYRAGQLEAAAEAALEAMNLGRVVGDPDAFVYLAAHFTAIRHAQDRCEELMPIVEETLESPDENVSDLSMMAGIAAIAAVAGDHERAAESLDTILEIGLGNLPRISTWSATMLSVVVAAGVLGKPDVAHQAYDLLKPFADLPIRPSMATICFGSIEWPLGIAARTTGDYELAVEHLERAVVANRRFENRPNTALAEAELAQCLVGLDRSRHRKRASDLLRSAAAIAAECEMPNRSVAWIEQAQKLEEVAVDQRPRIELVRIGDVWTLTLGGRSVNVAHTVGMTHIDYLVTEEGNEVAVEDLIGIRGRWGQPNVRTDLVDQQALRSYLRRIDELRETIERATQDNDLVRVEIARTELDALNEHLKSATGLAGKVRSFTDDVERARVSVRKAISRAIGRIEGLDPMIGSHLRDSITTGRHCRYQRAR